MPRTRLLKPTFFVNDTLAECDPLARLLFMGLWCLSDGTGRLEYRPGKIKAQVLPYDDCDVDRLVMQLESRGFVRTYLVGERVILQICKFKEHQKPHPHEPKNVFPAEEMSTSKGLFEEPEKEMSSRDLSCQAVTKRPLALACTSLALALALNTNTSPSGDESSTLPPKRQSKKSQIAWSDDDGWQGITEKDREGWGKAYPAATLETELAKASEWLKANPTKSRRKNWRKFLTGWLCRCQDAGGTTRGQGNRIAYSTPERPCKPFTGEAADIHRSQMARLARDQIRRAEADDISRELEKIVSAKRITGEMLE